MYRTATFLFSDMPLMITFILLIIKIVMLQVIIKLVQLKTKNKQDAYRLTNTKVMVVSFAFERT